MICHGRTVGRNWTQEVYETASRDAATRARDLRKVGYRVSVGAMGDQVTSVGSIKLTLVTIYSDDVPAPEHFERV